MIYRESAEYDNNNLKNMKISIKLYYIRGQKNKYTIFAFRKIGKI